MEVRIEPYNAHHLDAIIQLSLRAWTPVFESIQNAMDVEVYRAFYPDGWRVSQQKAIEEVCTAKDAHVWVALDAGSSVGFIAVKLHSEDSMGEIYMVAVDPDVQGQGIGSALVEFALSWMKESGMSVAMVETGGDPGHAPARRTYEKAGLGQKVCYWMLQEQQLPLQLAVNFADNVDFDLW
jgi:GNAT superfamily N-acetyltransferase